MFLIFFILLLAAWVTPDGEECRTPYNIVGDCISIKQCQAMVDYLRNTPKPLPKNTVRQIQKYNCGFEGKYLNDKISQYFYSKNS